MAAIVLRDVVKDWNGTRAVDQISFEAAPAKLLVLLGPSGCGKSTTLRLIAGLEQASSGKIEIGGRDVTALPPSERNISMVFQSYALFPHLSVAENILFGLKVRRVAVADRTRRLNKVADLVGLAHLLERKPAQLSGGQRQRVALGRAIIAEAPVCLMDEPLSNLDAQLRHDMRTEIRALQQRLGMTMVYVTHDQTEAMTMADQVILMRDGRIEQRGTPEELYQKPQTAFAARFLGTPAMNLIPLSDFAAAIPEHLRPLNNGVGLQVGVRPEHLALGPNAHSVAARVETVEYLGADSVITCRVGGARVAVRTSGIAHLVPGAETRMHLLSSNIHFYRSDGQLFTASAAQPTAA